MSSVVAKLARLEVAPTLPLPLLLLMVLLPRLKDPPLRLKDGPSRADVDSVTPFATSVPFTTAFLKLRGLRVGVWFDRATKKIGQNIMSRSARASERVCACKAVKEREEYAHRVTIRTGRTHA